MDSIKPASPLSFAHRNESPCLGFLVTFVRQHNKAGASNAGVKSPTMVQATILAGGLSPFIYIYLLDTVANTLTRNGSIQTAGNPSWISLFPHDIAGSDGRVL
jgi:hypothetical protein